MPLRNMSFRNRLWKYMFFIFSGLCVAAIGVSLICDLVINRRLTWSLYVLSAVPYMWLVAAPTPILQKHRSFITLGIFSVLLLPYLAILEKITPVRGWFAPMAVAVTITVLLAIWTTLLLIRFVKLNKWYLAAILVFIYGVLVYGFVHVFVNAYCGQRLLLFSDVMVMVACMVITVLLGVIGHGGGIKKKEQP